MELPHVHYSLVQLFYFFGPKVVTALACGLIIGLERELKQKAAGLKTNVLICVGSMLFSSISVLVAATYADSGFFGDPARISAQVVSGIGFLGGGAIIQSRGNIIGLTTAASIWVVAAIGLLIGLGYHTLSVVISIITVLTLVFVTLISNRFFSASRSYAPKIVFTDPSGVIRTEILDLLSSRDLILRHSDFLIRDGKTILHVEYFGEPENHRLFISDLWKTEGMIEVKRG